MTLSSLYAEKIKASDAYMAHLDVKPADDTTMDLRIAWEAQKDLLFDDLQRAVRSIERFKADVSGEKVGA